MVDVQLTKAKDKLSELFTMALRGETVLITGQTEGQSVRLMPVPSSVRPAVLEC